MVGRKISKRKQKWFAAIAILLPFLFLFLVEILLRLFSYGHNTDLFIRYPDNTAYYVMNKYASERFFSDSANETIGFIEPFRIKKAPGTIRIFVLGESTTAGYPYFHNGSFHRWLEYRLMHCYPSVHFEIINVSLTAVNSYTVSDFGKQVTAYQPDAILIYTGHNEYYGALGIGSTSYLANNRFLVKTILELRKLRLVQLLENIVRKFKHKSPTDTRENLMKRMASSLNIKYGSADFMAGIRQFKHNMNEVCKLFSKKGIPVFISTLVCNEKDQPPFISGTGSNDANAAFREADSAYREKNYVLAKREYIHAKELDLLRFRAPEAMDSIIIKLTRTYKNVHLVDTRQVFDHNSPHGILGKETLLDHVHPNLYGYALMSDAFYRQIERSGLINAPRVDTMSFGELLNRMPVTKIDSLYGRYTIMMLESGWPFNKPIPLDFKVGHSMDEQLAGALSVNRITWLDAINQLFQYSVKKGDKVTACKAVEAAMLEYPLNTTYKIYAGRLNYELGFYTDAVRDMKAAYDLDGGFTNTQNMYLVYLKTDQPKSAIKYIKAACQMRPKDIRLQAILNTTQTITALKEKLMKSPGDSSIKAQILMNYRAIGIAVSSNKYLPR